METLEPNPDLIPYLPESLRFMLDVIPLDAVLALVRHYGGTSLFVPRNITKESALAKVIGFENARRLVWHYQTERLYVSNAYRLHRYMETRQRNEAIVKAYSDGVETKVIARAHHISDRSVYLIVKRHIRQTLNRPGNPQCAD